MKFWSVTGLVDYTEALRLQHRLVKLRIEGQIEDTLLFLEHSPVITRGRGLQNKAKALCQSQDEGQVNLSKINIVDVERGGGLTYHGPGQWVVYPICLLVKKDIHAFLRHLEFSIIELLRIGYGVIARTIPHATGVWVGEKKIASIGIALRKWVTFHGLALNVINSLDPYFCFSPCGFRPEVMTRLADVLSHDHVLGPNWRVDLESCFLKTWNSDLTLVK